MAGYYYVQGQGRGEYYVAGGGGGHFPTKYGFIIVGHIEMLYYIEGMS